MLEIHGNAAKAALPEVVRSGRRIVGHVAGPVHANHFRAHVRKLEGPEGQSTETGPFDDPDCRKRSLMLFPVRPHRVPA